MLCTGVALYGTSHIHPMDAFQAGKSFFDSIGQPYTGASYYALLSDGDHEGDHDIFEVSCEELYERIKCEQVSSFWIYSQQRGTLPWDAAFTCQSGEFGRLPHLAAHVDMKSDDVHRAMSNWLGITAERLDVPYGIIYTANKLTAALHYAAGDNGTFIFPFEDGFAFKHANHGLYDRQSQYIESMLRMVYPYNLLNEHHLLMKMGDQPLRDWINGSTERGILRSIGQDRWMWEVMDEHLAVVNQACGAADMLVAWRPERPKKLVKKLP
ncbi:hypothetical protein [Paenibacillus guangzhouensis]|uniref:hypothetical protein n=1 Tax=Paenibacillus guangzhouensis TaxID=1473112 RepID=UPI001266C282|nr:hypothetical protein [Paenibacillus guangzhouensis]